MTDPKVDAFLAWALNDRGRSPNTVARYAAVLGQLHHPSTATVEEVEAWWNTRLHLSPATRENDLACLRSFYRWLARFDHRTDDPTRRLDAPKVSKRQPRPIVEAELAHMFEVTIDIPDLRRALALGAYAGMRVSEAASADWSNVNREARRIFIRGKGNKERVFGLSPMLLDKIEPETGGNIVAAGGPPYTAATLQRKINRLLEREGIEHTFHDLRKRAATLALARTKDMNGVRAAFGWESMDTVKVYAAVGDEALDKIAEAVI